jgi:hypothetical protein
MSINTANLITTQNGQAELAEVHRVNAELFKDHRDISVELLFPYIAISDKTPEVIEGTSSITDEMVKQEPCWANVDICQTQTYATLGVLKRDFAIGGLFEVKQDIENARTVILYARTRIVDSRSSEKKGADSNRSAADIVENNYGYIAKMLPYAYTRVLDSNGEYLETGITIGASRYGRSRHRFYFNYIIDNNDGIADNITVGDVVYPYSDGYLSKTAFELGLERYEKAIKEYMAEYEKYANGRNLYYENYEDAVTHTVSGNKFYLEDNNVVYNFPNIDLKSTLSNYGRVWQAWATSQLTSYTFPETYKDLTAKNYDPYAQHSVDGTPINSAVHERGMQFSKTIIKRVQYKKLDGEVLTKYMPMKIGCLLMVRTGLPYLDNLTFNSVYNFMRISLQFYDEENNRVIDVGFELCSSDGFERTNDADLFFIPQIPSFGEIKIEELTSELFAIRVLTLTQDIKSEISQYDQDYGDGNGCRLSTIMTIREINVTVLRNSYDEETHTSEIYILRKSIYRRYETQPNQTFVFPTNNGVPADLDHSTGGLFRYLQDNFEAGYAFSVKVPNNADRSYYMILPKEFNKTDIDVCESEEKVYDGSDGILWGCYIINDNSTVVEKHMNVIVDANKMIDTGNSPGHFVYDPYIHDDIYFTHYKLFGDFRLHNVRILLGEDASSNYRNVASSSGLIIVIYTDNGNYVLRLTYADLLGSANVDSDVCDIEILSFSVTDKFLTDTNAKDSYPICEFVMSVKSGDGVDFTERLITRRIYFNGTNWNKYDYTTNRPKRNVAITDISGSINLITETVCK